MTPPKIRYFLREALQNLWQFKTRHIFSLTIICLSFVTVGVVLSLSGNLRDRAKELSKNLTVVFYLRQDVGDAEREAVETRVRRSPLIGAVKSISPDQALGRFRTNFPHKFLDLYRLLVITRARHRQADDFRVDLL